jgi:hypothetical protein
MKIKVPEKCLYCGAGWRGGHEVPGKDMKVGLRVFYDCGASLAISEKEDLFLRLLFKGCIKSEEDEREKK